MSDSKSGSKSNLNESNMPLLDDVSFSSQKSRTTKNPFLRPIKNFIFLPLLHRTRTSISKDVIKIFMAIILFSSGVGKYTNRAMPEHLADL